MLSFTMTGRAQYLSPDTLNIEEIALKHFVSNIDSITIFYGSYFKLFDSSLNKIYFNGVASIVAALNFELFRQKKGFLIPDSSDLVSASTWIYPQRKGITKISSPSKVSICNYKYFQNYSKIGDIYITMSNRYFHNGCYYVRIFINIGNDNIRNDFYVKIDKEGNILDSIIQYGQI